MAEMIPEVMVFSRPAGEPMAKILSPGVRVCPLHPPKT